MKSVPKLIRRFVGLLLLGSTLLIILNAAAFMIVAVNQSSNGSPWTTAADAAKAIQKTDSGYAMTDDMSRELSDGGIWAIFIDNKTLKVVWQGESLPDSIPTEYTASSISELTRGYIDDYPTFTASSDDGLMVLGYPHESYWKHLWPSWDYHIIESLPKIALSILAMNVLLLFLMYFVANTRLIRSVKPITNGIRSLGMGETVHIREKGLLSEIAVNINKTSEALRSQRAELIRKDAARANWIAGVSHDIRTPLSMVMGCASQLEENKSLPEAERKKASLIRRQSERMRDLILDLNLASKLEYDMQPIDPALQKLLPLVRSVAADFVNSDIGGKYPAELVADEASSRAYIECDRELIKRAVSNLLHNCMNHNIDGCSIFISVNTDEKSCSVSVDDDGIGVTDEQLERLNDSPHYMVSDRNTTEQRHGLGLLIAGQVARSHGGALEIGKSSHGGFSARITLPVAGER